MQPVRQHENSFEVVEGLDFKWTGGRSRSAKSKYRFRDALYRIEAHCEIQIALRDLVCLDFLMTNDELKAEADLMIRRAGLPELFAPYARWFVGGSYSYDLMCWRDLDVYVFDPEHGLKQCFDIGYEVTMRLAAKKARFTNNIGGEPNGLYWGIKLGDERKGAWKIDIWLLDAAGYEEHGRYSAEIRRRLRP